MKAIVFLACIFVTSAREYQPFGAWHRYFQDKMDKCLWFPKTTLSQDNAYVPKITFNSTWKFGQICDLPPMNMFLSCEWEGFLYTIKECSNSPDIPEWRRENYKSILETMPKAKCISVRNGLCKCCRHPFHPNKYGTACIENNTCPAFNKPNDWSECLWFPRSNIINEFKDHCKLDYGPVDDVFPPPGFSYPDKCGMCSFRIRCRNRERTDGCFHVQVDKKVCGGKDCPGCGDACTIPYLNGTNCNWINFIGYTISNKALMLTVNPDMPKWLKDGMKVNLLKDLPRGICKDMNGQCKCCCQPYTLNADGTKCVLSEGACFFDHIFDKNG